MSMKDSGTNEIEKNIGIMIDNIKTGKFTKSFKELDKNQQATFKEEMPKEIINRIGKINEHMQTYDINNNDEITFNYYNSSKPKGKKSPLWFEVNR